MTTTWHYVLCEASHWMLPIRNEVIHRLDEFVKGQEKALVNIGFFNDHLSTFHDLPEAREVPKLADDRFFVGCGKNVRMIVKKKNLAELDYLYAYQKPSCGITESPELRRRGHGRKG